MEDIGLKLEGDLLFEVSKYLAFGLSILFGFIGYLLKLNNRKRSNIYSLSKLLEEVMDYMETSSTDEKRKYEYFVDSLAEKEKIARDKAAQKQV